MNKNWLESGRIETLLALGILAAVGFLFLRFYQPQTPPPAPRATPVQAGAVSGTPTHP